MKIFSSQNKCIEANYVKGKIDKTLNLGETDLTVRAYDKLFLKKYRCMQNREGRVIHQKLCK